MFQPNSTPFIGVGLRHPHYEIAITTEKVVDFLEVHAENFFADGGASLAVLNQVKEKYPISIHGTALSLGSQMGLSQEHIEKLKKLVEGVNPMLVSDHACFARTRISGQTVHAGDLLPITFNQASNDALVSNIIQVQTALNRPILIENLSAYINLPDATMEETEFLSLACERANCGLLLDLNNLVVNAKNSQSARIVDDVCDWIDRVPKHLVGEFHLAGCTPVSEGQVMVDDHSHPVPGEVWEVYRYALQRFGNRPTLIEWDTHIPEWDVLVSEATYARKIALEVMNEQTPSRKDSHD